MADVRQSFQIDIVEANTPYRLPSVRGHEWEITTYPGNSGNVFMGRNDQNITTLTGFYLPENQILVLEIPDLDSIYVLSDSAGDRITVIRRV